MPPIAPCAFRLTCHYILEPDGQMRVLTIVLVSSEPSRASSWHYAYVEDHARLRPAYSTKFTNRAALTYINEELRPRAAELLPRMARALDVAMRADSAQSLTLSVRVQISRAARTFSGGGEVRTDSTEWLRWGGSTPELRPACAAHPALAGALRSPNLLDELERPALLALFGGAF